MNNAQKTELPMGGLSSMVFVMISGSALYYAPFAKANVPLLALVVSFAVSLLLVKMYTALSENKAGLTGRILTVILAPLSLVQLGKRLFDFFSLCEHSGEKYTGNLFTLLSLASISFIALYSVHKGGTTPFRTALLSSLLPVAFAFVFIPIPFIAGSELSGGFHATRFITPKELFADFLIAIKCTILMTADLAAVYLAVPKSTFSCARRKFGIKGFGGLAFGYLFAAVNAEVLRLYYGGVTPDTPFINSVLLDTAYSDGGGSSEYGALCLCFFTLTLILRTSLYAILLARAAKIVKNMFQRHNMTVFSAHR